MTPEHLIARAERAKQLLEEPLIKEALERIEGDIKDAWAQTPIRDKEGQHELLLLAKSAQKFRDIFSQFIATGEMSKNALKRPRLTRTLERFGIHD